MSSTIALLTDFGTDDIYVGVMKGVMRQIAPNITFLDITHAIEPQHVRRAAFALLNAYRYFPPDTVFLVVVDPGVGSTRQPIACQVGDYLFVAPDNGVLSYVLAEYEDYHAVELTSPDYRSSVVSNTFHGRDIFAPAAAHLAKGVHLDEFGTRLDRLTLLPPPELTVEGRRVMGEVLSIDRFGNIVTSIGIMRWVASNRLTLEPVFGSNASVVPVSAEDAVVTLNEQRILSISTSYSEVPRGELLALLGSTGYLEISVNQGNAAARLDVAVGDRVEIMIGDIHAAIRD